MKLFVALILQELNIVNNSVYLLWFTFSLIAFVAVVSTEFSLNWFLVLFYQEGGKKKKDKSKKVKGGKAIKVILD